jgi:DNA mismatch repair protein MutS2
MITADRQTQDALEFNKVKELAARFALSPAGAKELLILLPLSEREALVSRQKLVGELKEIIKSQAPFPAERFEDLSPLFSKLKVEGIILTPKELWEAANFFSLVNRLVGARKELQERFPALTEFLSVLQHDKIFPEACYKALEPTGEVKDNATALLKSLRQKIRDFKTRIEEKLWKILAQKGLAERPEGYVTLREGRYVIPFGEKDPDLKKAIVHDRSGTGATFFAEPLATVGMNNELKEAELEEVEEVKRILFNLSVMVLERREKLEREFKLLAQLDWFWGMADFGHKTEAVLPQVSDGDLVLLQAQHPLLLFSKGEYQPGGVVANDIVLTEKRRILLISGPNAGGKTVALKLTGLFALMFQSGFPLPVKEGSRLPVLKKIFAAIGDEQSIELSLSSFSAHLVRLKESLKDLTADCLLLFDELLSGTDPKEGAALADAFLGYLHGVGVKVVVTTHYSSLKTLPEIYPGMQNASLDFNTQTLRPTYRLRTGIPGASFAIELAGRMELPEEIIGEARSKIGASERELSTLLAKVAEKERTLDDTLRETQKKAERISIREEALRVEEENFRQTEKEKKKKMLEEAAHFVRQARREMDDMIDAAKKQAKEKTALEASRRQVSARLQQIETEKQNLDEQIPLSNEPLKAGNPVYIPLLKAVGRLIALPAGSSGEAVVEVQGKTYRIKPNNLKAVETPSSLQTRTAHTADYEEISSFEIDVRGALGDEAVEQVDRFIDRALLANLSSLRIVHGKGTGVLRKRIGEFLRTHSAVEEFRAGELNEGGDGVTVVKLKS